jgi:hypothetical protein
MSILVLFVAGALALFAPARVLAGEAGEKESAQPAAEAPPAPEISTDAKDGKAALDGYVHPGAMVGRPLMHETPLMVEAAKRPAKELWNEMGLIEDEMKLYAEQGRYDSLVDLADRWVADMMAVFNHEYPGAIVPRQVGMKRALMSCARVGNEIRSGVESGEDLDVSGAVGLVTGCNRLFARFLPPKVTGLPDEFADYREPDEAASGREAAKPE